MNSRGKETTNIVSGYIGEKERVKQNMREVEEMEDERLKRKRGRVREIERGGSG